MTRSHDSFSIFVACARICALILASSGRMFANLASTASFALALASTSLKIFSYCPSMTWSVTKENSSPTCS